MLFRLNSLELALVLAAIVFGATGVAIMLGRRHRERSDMREPFAVLQGALLGVVGLILAFGLSLAVGRYQDRRAAVVDEANAIGTTYLRAQMLAEPVREPVAGAAGAVHGPEHPARHGCPRQREGEEPSSPPRTRCSDGCGRWPGRRSRRRRWTPLPGSTSRP